jgi:dihydrofolate synthase/folylpolyglutamate synthase
MNESDYQHKLEELFVRFPSVQKTGFGDAYKPGLAHMEEFGALLGHPDRAYRTIHVAGTNGKGSVANMLASALAATGLRVGLYTSPHILDFRERMRILDAGSDGPARLVSKEAVWNFITEWEETFDRLDLSFFEITTGMAFRWFADEKVDLAVIEVGLGGRLDSTNIITPEVSVITSIGLDHCAMLGGTRAEIAGEKAGVFKPGVPAVVGTHDGETAPVFEARAASVNCPLVFASGGQGGCGASPLPSSGLEMDLQGEWQEENLRTVLTVLAVMGVQATEEVLRAIAHTARRMDFHGRWELLHRDPDMLCDIGHNPPALKRNFAQLEQYLAEGRYGSLIIVYGVMADKDLDGIIPLMPREATYIAVAPDTPRAMKAEALFGRLSEAFPGKVLFGGSVASGLELASGLAADLRLHLPGTGLNGASARSDRSQPEVRQPIPGNSKPLIYIGGSTFVVSEAVTALRV